MDVDNDFIAQIKSLITAINNLLPHVKRVIGLNRDIIQRYAELSEQAAGIFERFSSFEDIYSDNNAGLIREINELTEAVNRLERLAILDKTGFGSSWEAVKIRGDIQADYERDFLNQQIIDERKLLSQRMKTLSRHQMRAARYGGYDSAPVEIQNDIESTQLDIDESKVTLEHLQAALKALDKGE